MPFDEFWALYRAELSACGQWRDIGPKAHARKAFERLSPEDQETALRLLPSYLLLRRKRRKDGSVISTAGWAFRYLREQRWREVPVPASGHIVASAEHLNHGHVIELGRARIAEHKRRHGTRPEEHRSRRPPKSKPYKADVTGLEPRPERVAGAASLGSLTNIIIYRAKENGHENR